MKPTGLVAVLASTFILTGACGSSTPADSANDAGAGGPGTSGTGTGTPDTGAAPASPDGSAGATDSGLGSAPDGASTPSIPLNGCSLDPPAGAKQADPLPTYSGTCPTFVAAPAANTITSSGNARSFMLAVPANLKPGEKLPVIFLWYWLGGSAMDFYTVGAVQAAVDSQRFLAVIPTAKGDLEFKWPFNVADPQPRMDEEFQFFDDMLACVAAQYPTVNRNCVGSVGVSAGALFTDQLAGARSNRISAFESLSGGVGGTLIRTWANPTRSLPGIVLWGGPTDDCFGLLDFQTESQNLEKSLETNGDFFVECVHNCGHAAPPFTAPSGLSTYAGLWDFIFDHPFWLATGESPYTSHGLPTALPPWCGIGAGSAVPRTGACPGKPGC